MVNEMKKIKIDFKLFYMSAIIIYAGLLIISECSNIISVIGNWKYHIAYVYYILYYAVNIFSNILIISHLALNLMPNFSRKVKYKTLLSNLRLLTVSFCLRILFYILGFLLSTNSQVYVAEMIRIIFATMFVFLVYLGLKKTKIKNSKKVRRMYEIICLLIIIAYGYNIYLYASIENIYSLLFHCGLLLIFMINGFLIFNNQNLYMLAIDYFTKITSHEKDEEYWKEWINKNLPDEKDQQELLKTLSKKRKRTKFGITIGTLIIAGTTWLILEACAAIYQKYVLVFFDNFFK